MPEGRLLVVSPHYDDASFSCAAILARPGPVDVLTVFGGEPDPPRQGWWDRACGFESSAESMAARREEERKAFAGTAHRLRALPLLELQYVEGERPTAEGNAIVEAVLDWLASGEGGTVALPAGAGRKLGRLTHRLAAHAPGRLGYLRHPDHVFARNAVVTAVRQRPVTLILYEELPYVWTTPADAEVREIEAAWGFAAQRFSLPVDSAAKARTNAAYASQLAPLETRRFRLDDPSCVPDVERYWRLAPA